MRLLGQRPMSTKNHLRSAMNVSWGTVQHHVGVLKRAGLVASVRVGRSERFFAPDGSREDAERVALLRGRRIRQLASFIAGNPGAVQSTLTRDLSMHRKVLRDYMDRLVTAGLVEENRDGRFQVYHASSKLEPALCALAGSEEPSAIDEDHSDKEPWNGRV